MEVRHGVVVGGAALALGVLIGWWLPRSSGEVEPVRSSRETRAGSESSHRRAANTTPGTSMDARRSEDRSDDRAEDLPPPATGASADEPATHELALRRIRELRQERIEILGEPVERRAQSPMPQRYSSEALSGAFRTALQREEIEGDVEGVDCSEYPCIVFGRLVGDEEDVEELERSDALSEYQNDVLTLLLWAASARDEDAHIDEALETALFAIAFYEEAEREAHGRRLDRRIRARVMEVWNSDRPGRFDPDPHE